MDNSRDTIDLKPYFKIFKRTYNKVAVWFNQKIIFILIIFITLIGLKAITSALGETSYKYSGIINKELISNNNIIHILEFLDKKILASNSKKNHESEDSNLDLFNKLTKVEYDLALKMEDEININSNKDLDSIDLDLNVPLEITLHSNYIIDSIGEKFITYMNNHPFLEKLKRERIIKWNKQKDELLAKIDFADKMISKSQTKSEESDNNTIYINNNKHQEVYSLIKYKDNLIEKLSLVESYLQRSQNKEVFIIAGFEKIKKSKYSAFYSLRFYITYFFYSFLAVLLISTLFRSVVQRNQ